MHAPRPPHIVSYLTTVRLRPFSFLLLSFFVSLEMMSGFFPSGFVPLQFSLYGEYGVRVFLSDGAFLPCDYGLDFFM